MLQSIVHRGYVGIFGKSQILLATCPRSVSFNRTPVTLSEEKERDEEKFFSLSLSESIWARETLSEEEKRKKGVTREENLSGKGRPPDTYSVSVSLHYSSRFPYKKSVDNWRGRQLGFHTNLRKNQNLLNSIMPDTAEYVGFRMNWRNATHEITNGKEGAKSVFPNPSWLIDSTSPDFEFAQKREKFRRTSVERNEER